MNYQRSHYLQEQDLQAGVYLSPLISTVKNSERGKQQDKSRNKENCNVQNEITQLLKSYQPNKKLEKISLPVNCVSSGSKQQKQILEDLFNQIKTNKSSCKNSKRNSTSPITAKQKKQHFLSQNDNLELSPIYKNEVQSPKNPKTSKQTHFKCTYHQNKKAKFFNQKEKGSTILYCSDCSMKQLLQGSMLYPLESLMSQSSNNDHRQQRSESGLKKADYYQLSSVTRANFWSVDDNSLLSSLGAVCDKKQQQNTFNSCCDEEYFVKEKELQEFVSSVEMLKEKCGGIVGKTLQDDFNMCSIKLNKLCQELQQMLYLINLQSIKLIKTMHKQFQQQLQQQEVMRKVSDIERDLQNITNDISANQENIVNNMQLQPFRYIIEKYNEKLNLHDSALQQCCVQQKDVKISIEQVQQQVQKLTRVKKMLCSQFSFDQIQIADLKEDEVLQSTQRKLSRTKLNANGRLADNIYISFENKDLFLAAQRGSMHVMPKADNFISQNPSQAMETDVVQIESPEEQKLRRNLIDSPNFLK